MATFPRTLIQIHYHNRIGGVSEVMRQYALAFEKISAGKKHSSVFICNDTGSKVLSGVGSVVSISSCDYRTFTQVSQFENLRDSLQQAVEKVILDKRYPAPVCVMAHNLSLGKNCALSAAFARCVQTLSEKGITFISFIHDRAEEGRASELHQINLLKSFGVDIWNDLYPRLPNLVYALLNQHAQDVMTAYGLPVIKVFNPVVVDKAPLLLPKQITEGLHALSVLDGTSFNAEGGSVVYPARVTARKNIVEAVLVACLIGHRNLLLGGCGASEQDQRLYMRLRRMCARHSLSVVFDCARLTESAKGSYTSQQVFHDLCRFSKVCLTTAVREGFGYSYYEPWCLDASVIGRKPMHFDPAVTLDFSGLYDALLIPIDWIDIADTEKKYFACLKQCTGNQPPVPVLDFRQQFIIGNCIDFGMLDLNAQFGVMERLVQNPGDSALLKFRYGDRDVPAGAEIFDSTASGKANCAMIKKRLSLIKFESQTEKLLTAKPKILPLKAGETVVSPIIPIIDATDIRLLMSA